MAGISSRRSMRCHLAGWVAVFGFFTASIAPVHTGSAATHGLRVAAPSASERASCVRDKMADLRFVSLAYPVVLGHNGSDHDTMYLASRLQYPTSMTYVEVAEVLTKSLEARRDQVMAMYQLLLHRPGDAAGVDGWARWLAGGTPTDLAAALMASQEYANRAGGTNGGWIDQAYADILGRAPDSAGRAQWLGQLDAGRSRMSVARDLYLAREHRLALVEALYQRVLGRAADPGGADYWADRVLSKGETWTLTRMVASGDFWRRAQVAYGGAPTTQPPPCPKPDPSWPGSPRLVYSLADHPNRARRLIALTFDDGPNPTWTPQILDVLASRNVKATFFAVGSWAQRYPELIRRELAEGHRVANHTWDHLSLTSLSPAGQANAIRRTTDVLNSIAGRLVVRCVRPPYGNRNNGSDAVAFGQGLSVIIWSRDSGDWRRPGTAQIIAQSIDSRYDAGRGILGMHDGGGDRSQMVAALGPLIDTLRSQGYEFATIC